jgi:oligopeptide transport system substrate-binding protein
LTLITLLIGFFLFACGADQRVQYEPDTFRMNLGTEPPTLDWNLATDSASFDVIANIMEGLTEYDRELKPVPALASSWQVQGKKIIFKLRDDVLWSDGRRVRASDFEYSWKRLLNPATAAEYAYFLYDIEGAQEYNTGMTKDPDSVGVKALDETTLEVRLKHPVPYFPSITTFMVTFPMRKDLVEKYSSKWTDPENLVTNGPFRIASWKHEDELVLVANERYFGTKPKLKKVMLLIINEASTALSLYERGDLDMADGRSIPASDIPRLRSRPDYHSMPVLRNNYYGFNISKPPFDDLRVRKAFAKAIPREIIPRVLKGGEIPTTSWVPPGMMGYEPGIGLKFDPEGARRLLAEAGYPGGKDFPAVTAYYNTDENNRLVAETLQALWKENLNVGVELANMEWKVFLKMLNTDPPQLYRLGWAADYPDPDNFLNLFTSTSGNNHTGWADGNYDQIIAQAARANNPEARQALYRRAQELLLEEAVAIVPLYITSRSILIRPHVKGFWQNRMAILRLKDISIQAN